ncbi:MAG: hypothetical protein N2Z23_00655 [Pyrinomonadaceae bacterium]|nr:hypothetical protein [Pyrinomonadaceae bacterium]MCX7638943.1 hypothetical protein [Pyrinomonadaceae bacterium]MDW8304920.1 FmdB family zinc ribbon protein [Acidobacteriota bacterium]
MPIYEYKCNSCGIKIEKIQRFSEPPLKTCQSCGGELEKLWSLSGFQFKGTGWYVTDYARKSVSDSTSKSEEASKACSPSGCEMPGCAAGS